MGQNIESIPADYYETLPDPLILYSEEYHWDKSNGQVIDDLGLYRLQRRGEKPIFPGYNSIGGQASKTRRAN